ncbi:MAG: nuclear transport factor 2 family protein [Planctomycetes bacterium]|nr:nuclear transport factor 2 family protein [Planctomycetota bacterium]
MESNRIKTNPLYLFLIVVYASSLSITSCVKQGTARTENGTLEAENAHLVQLDTEFCQETSKRGVDGWVSYFAENGAMSIGDHPPITGHAAIRKVMGPAFNTPGFSLRWKPKDAGILIPNKLGYTTGRYTRKSINKDGDIVTQEGTYITIWKKQKEDWKVLFDTGEPDAAPVKGQ